MENNLKPIKEILENDSIKSYRSDCQVIEKIHGENLINTDKGLFFRKYRVHPEFRNLVKTPLDIFTTIRDPFPEFHKLYNNKVREHYCAEIAKDLNLWIQERYQNIPSLSKTARFVRVDEYGSSSNNVHVHLLWHIHEKAPRTVVEDIFEYLNRLEPHEHKGVRCFDNQIIYDKLGIVSYICKIEDGREFKKFGYSPFFYKIYQRKILKGTWK